MAQGKKLIGVIIGVIIAMALFPAFNGAVTENTGTQAVTNETVTADVGTYVELGGYKLVTGSETVYGFNDTSGSYEAAAKGTDYEIRYEQGEVKVLNGSSLIGDSEEMKVSYDYKATSGTSTTVADLLPLLVLVLILGLLGKEVQSRV